MFLLIQALALTALILGVISIISAFGVYGSPKSDTFYLEKIGQLKQCRPAIHGERLHLISFLDAKYFGGHQTFISKMTPMSFWFARYYLHGYGFIPYWYKSHDVIVDLYKELKEKQQ